MPRVRIRRVKVALTSRTSLSTQKCLQLLIPEEDLGDRKLTKILRSLKQLADGQKLHVTMFKQLSLQRFPSSVQAIFASSIPSSTLQMLAETADCIPEYHQPPVTVNVASRSTTAPTIEDVMKHLDDLTLEVPQFRASPVSRPRRPANRIAGCLSRPGINAITCLSIDLERMTELQQQPDFSEQPEHTNLQLKAIPLFATFSKILCDVSREFSRPMVPSEMRRDVFTALRNLTHPGIKALSAPRRRPALTDLGCSRVRTTAYHPSFNGLVGRFPRGLKTSLRAYDNPTHWNEHLPSVVLGIRTSLKPDLECSTAEPVYGTTLRIPGDFFGPSQSFADLDATDYVQRLGQAMVNLRTIPTRTPADCARKPLQRPYDEPFRVMSRTEKRFKIARSDHTEVVSIGRLKVTYTGLPSATPTDQPSSPSKMPSSISPPPLPPFNRGHSPLLPLPPPTRSGRRARCSDRYQLVHYA
ncbi:hypothetical protein SprV_0200839300 [Sparganum proliferum]